MDLDSFKLIEQRTQMQSKGEMKRENQDIPLLKNRVYYKRKQGNS
jgi:hypothetical protein